MFLFRRAIRSTEFARSTHIFAAVLSCHAAVPSSIDPSQKFPTQSFISTWTARSRLHITLANRSVDSACLTRCFFRQPMRKSVFVSLFAKSGRGRRRERANCRSFRWCTRYRNRTLRGERPKLDCSNARRIRNLFRNTCLPTNGLPVVEVYSGVCEGSGLDPRERRKGGDSRYFYAWKRLRMRGRDGENYHYWITLLLKIVK